MATIEERLEKLEKAIGVTDGGAVYIGSPSKIVLKAPALQFEGGVTILMNAGMTLDLKAGGVAHLQGGVVRLNGGQRPAAYAGSQVIPDFPPFMKVNTGSPRVFV